MSNKVRKNKDGLFFTPIEERRFIGLDGKQRKMVTYSECDKDGNIGDGNEDGTISYETILCIIPEDKQDIDLSTLSENCLK